jgi:peptidoglycan/LPS O-acetylase OafA/YrhL
MVMPLTFWLAIAPQPPARAVRALGLLGALSFPLYALHQPILLAISFQSRSAGACQFAVCAALAGSALVAWIGPRTGKALFAALARVFQRQAPLAPVVPAI